MGVHVNSKSTANPSSTDDALVYPTSVGELALRPAQELDLIAAARHEIASVPVGDSATTTAFIERFELFHKLTQGLNQGLENFTSLKTSHHLVLQALANELSHPRHIARRIGMDTAAVEVTLGHLADKGLVIVGERSGGRIVEAALTEPGRAALSQAEAVQFRALDAMLQQIPRADVERLLEILDEASAITTRLVASLAESGAASNPAASD